MARALPTLPPVTDDHRRAAFVAMGWVGWTYETAMADAVRGRVVEARAHQLRKQQWAAQRWQRAPWPPAPAPSSLQPYQRAHLSDLKRAAAGDRDD